MFKEGQQPQEEHQFRASKDIPRGPRRDTRRIVGWPKFLLGVGLALVLLALAGLAFPARGAPVEHEGAGRALVVNRMGLMETTSALGENDRFLYLPLLITWENLVNVARAQPVANAVAVAPTSAIAVEVNREVDTDTVNGQTFRLWGAQSGLYEGTFDFPAGNSWQFEAALPFKPGEVVRAQTTGRILSNEGAPFSPFGWQFTTAVEGGSGSFTAHPTSPSFGTSSFSWGVTLGDLDNDGDLDAVVADGEDDASVWLNDGFGHFSPHPNVPSFGDSDTRGIALGDLDGDGDLDAVSGNQVGSNTIWLNDGSGNFGPHPDTPSIHAGETNDVALGDLDGDGDLDAVVISGPWPESVWLNDGSGNLTLHPTTPFIETKTMPTGHTADIALGDLDNDGDLDAVITNSDHWRPGQTVLLNDGAGNFRPHPTMPIFGSEGSDSIALGDLDGDGDLDALEGNFTYQTGAGVWLNVGSGHFTPHPDELDVCCASGVALGDADGDGDLDAIFADSAPYDIESVRLNDGDGNFSTHPDSPSFGGQNNTRDFAIGDLDGDGDLDVVLANVGLNEVWLNDD